MARSRSSLVHVGVRETDMDHLRRTDMWYSVTALGLAAVLSFGLLVPAEGRDERGLAVRMFGIRKVTPSVWRIDLGVSGLQPDDDLPEAALQATFGRTTARATIAFRMRSRFSMDIDLRKGKVLIGEFSVAEFEPVPPLDENTRLALAVTIRQGRAETTIHRTTTVALPTIIIPGYLNDMTGKPDPGILSALRDRGYESTGASPNLFWFNYRSRTLSLEGAASDLATFVRNVVLPSTYATRINVVGYSLGGLLARWNIAFAPGWDRLVNRLLLVGVPNEGAVMTYLYAFYAIAGPARTQAANSLLPAFPFWRATAGGWWDFPPDAKNPTLAELNTHPLPEGIRAYAFYGTRQPTAAGITGTLPRATVENEPGDGLVLAASALGLPIHGGTGFPGLADRLVAQVDLGPVRHTGLLNAAAARIADALLDRFAEDGPTASDVSRPLARPRHPFAAHRQAGYH